VAVACNFTPVERKGYTFGVPQGGTWAEVLNSDNKKYGGKGIGNYKPIRAKKKEMHKRKYCIEVTLPPFGVLVFSPQKTNSIKAK
jgi:1,4-alpha-glucan branching enzyme